MRCVVVKVGGSLLEWPELVPRLRSFLAANSDDHQVLLVGGGDFANAVRAADRHHGLSSERAHWHCVHALELTARLLADLLPEANLVERLADLRPCCRAPGLSLFACQSFLETEEPQLPGTRLSPNWETTSDAIAGRLAIGIPADGLVLLKSANPPTAASLQAWAACGFIDRTLAALAPELPAVEAWNLRTNQRTVVLNESDGRSATEGDTIESSDSGRIA